MRLTVMRPDGHAEVYPYYPDGRLAQQAWNDGKFRVGDIIGYRDTICDVIDGVDPPYSLVPLTRLNGMMCQVEAEPGDNF